MRELWAQQIRAGADELRVPLKDDQIAALVRHLELLQEAGQSLNLTSVPAKDFAIRHTLDSLTAFRAVQDAPEGRLIDLGSGAGFPGVPLAVATGRECELVESTGKKARFLEELVAELRLNVTVRGIRAEELAIVRRGAYTVAVARAVSALPSLIELAAPLLAMGGRLVCLKGELNAGERQQGERAARIIGFTELQALEVDAPGGPATRTLVVYERREEPAISLPRRPGAAQRHPLG